MIKLYSGTPGSGKSLHQARDIYYWLRLGNPVVANFDIVDFEHKGQFRYIPNPQLHPDALRAFAREVFRTRRFAEGAIRLYMDEAQLILNCRNWQSVDKNGWISFFTQHRKLGYDVILVAQYDRMLDRQIRSLIEYEVVHRKIANFGWKGKLLSIVLGGNSFSAVSIWYPLKEKTGSEIFHYHKKFGRLYDTYKLFDSDAAAQPVKLSAAKQQQLTALCRVLQTRMQQLAPVPAAADDLHLDSRAAPPPKNTIRFLTAKKIGVK